MTISTRLADKQLYLRFEGASIVTTLFIDGHALDVDTSAAQASTEASRSHEGAFQAFVFDVTRALRPGSHVVAVRVNNATHANIAPASGGDYSKAGGLYRDVGSWP